MTGTLPARSYKIDIVNDDGDWSAFEPVEPAIEEAVYAVEGHLTGAKMQDVCIALSSDAGVAELNGRYRGKNKPTNVLSFPNPAGGTLGDIILAVETIEKEAQEQSASLKHHLQHLIVHGVLHLLGYDHETVEDAERMEAIEIAILAKIGIENPYTEPLLNDTFGGARL